jgi:hypothetical protein
VSVRSPIPKLGRIQLGQQLLIGKLPQPLAHATDAKDTYAPRFLGDFTAGYMRRIAETADSDTQSQSTGGAGMLVRADATGTVMTDHLPEARPDGELVRWPTS